MRLLALMLLTSCGAVAPEGEASNPDRVPRLTPIAAVPPADSKAASVVAHAVTSTHGCMILEAGELRCFGSNRLGAIDGRVEVDVRDASPRRVPFIDGVREVATGPHFTCARDAAGVVCWGALDPLELHGHRPAVGPRRIGGWESATKITAGGAHACAILADGRISCLGQGREGQLGDGTGAYRASASVVPALNSIVDVSAGRTHTCAVRGDAAVFCWGDGRFGQLGNNENGSHPLPSRVREVDGRAVSAGATTTCVVGRDALVTCFGSGHLGDGKFLAPPATFRNVALGPVRSVAVSSGHACALTQEGAVACWGDNRVGAVSHEADEGLFPALLSKPRDVEQIAVGQNTTCALDASRALWCWGGTSDTTLFGIYRMELTRIEP